jgi:hypothetical protein
MVEIEGGVMKRHPLGPRPNHSLGKSAMCLTEVGENRLAKKAQKAAMALDQRLTKDDMPAISRALTEYAAGLIVEQYSIRDDFVLYRADERTFYVKAAAYTNYSFAASYEHDYFSKFIIPSFAHTRIVRVISRGGYLYLICSCCLFERLGITCCHIYKVLRRVPIPEDAVIRWHKSYRYYHLKNEALTAKFDQAIRNECPGPVFCESSDWPIGNGERPKEYFEETLPGKPAVICPGNRWDGKQDSTPTASRERAAPTTSGAKLPVLGMVEEIGLSQAAADNALDSFENGSLTQFDDDVSMVVAVQDSAAAVASRENEVSPKTQKERGEKWKRKLSNSTAYQLLHPHYVDFTNIAGSDPAIMEYAATAFRGLIADVQAMKADKQASNLQQKAENATGEFASFLEIDSAKVNKRIGKSNSPKRRKKRKH